MNEKRKKERKNKNKKPKRTKRQMGQRDEVVHFLFIIKFQRVMQLYAAPIQEGFLYPTAVIGSEDKIKSIDVAETGEINMLSLLTGAMNY